MTQNYLSTIPNIIIPPKYIDRSTTLIDHIFTHLPKSKIKNLVTSGNFITDNTDYLANVMIFDIETKTTMSRPYIRLYTEKKG